MTHLSAETIITDQLKAGVDSIANNRVLNAADMEGMTENSQPAASLQVIFFDEAPVSGKNGVSAHNQLVDQFWLVVVVVRNVKAASGVNARNDAGPIISDVIAALHHFDMGGHPFMKLVRVKAPVRATYRNGFFYFPMMFKTRFSTAGNKNG